MRTMECVVGLLNSVLVLLIKNLNVAGYRKRSICAETCAQQQACVKNMFYFGMQFVINKSTFANSPAGLWLNAIN